MLFPLSDARTRTRTLRNENNTNNVNQLFLCYLFAGLARLLHHYCISMLNHFA